MSTNEVTHRKPVSLLRALLSLLVPGLGQMVAGAFNRGLYLFLGVTVMGGLTVYTAAQRPRYPDYGLAFKVTLAFLGEAAGLLLFLVALFALARRYVLKDEFAQNLSGPLFAIVAVVAFGLSAPAMLRATIPPAIEREIYGFTALVGATGGGHLDVDGIRRGYAGPPGAAPDDHLFAAPCGGGAGPGHPHHPNRPAQGHPGVQGHGKGAEQHRLAVAGGLRLRGQQSGGYGAA